MYQILLADDEQIVIDSLTFILERNFPSQVELYSARSGSDAAEICRQHAIDIAFMDINMPGLNGIEAIKKIRECRPAVVIIVLTAFDRFEYAQQAVNLGVFEYLSKPVNRNVITATLRSAMSSVDQNRRREISEIQIREKLDSVATIVESDFIYSMIFPSDKGNDLDSYLNFFDISETSFFFVIFEILDFPESGRSQMYGTLRDILATAAQCVIGPLMRNRVVVFFPAVEELRCSEAASEAFVHSLYARLCTRLGLRIKVGVSRVESGLSRSLSAYNESLTALNSSDEQVGVFFAGHLDASLIHGDEYPVDIEKKLFDRVQAGDVQSVHSLFNALVGWLEQHLPDERGVAIWKLVEILVSVRKLARDMHHRFGGFSVWKDSWRKVNSYTDISSLAGWVLSEVDECLAVIVEHKQRRMSPIIVKACAYIDANLVKDIFLDDIAGRVEVSPFYFSKLFKEETGENFIDYLTMARIQKAKELLRDLSKSIKEVSAESGYSDPNYFSKLFKKAVGLTPTEYRERV